MQYLSPVVIWVQSSDLYIGMNRWVQMTNRIVTGAGLGVVELTVALHHIYDTPRDEICRMLSFLTEY